MSTNPTNLPTLPAASAPPVPQATSTPRREVDAGACAHYLRDLADTLRTTGASTTAACNLAYVWSVDLVHALSYAPASADTVPVRVAVENAASAWENDREDSAARAMQAASACEELAARLDAGVALAELGRGLA